MIAVRSRKRQGERGGEGRDEGFNRKRYNLLRFLSYEGQERHKKEESLSQRAQRRREILFSKNR